MKAEEILTLNDIGQELNLLKKNQSRLTLGDVRKSIRFYNNDHKILHDPELRDEWIKEKEIDPETNKSEWIPHKKTHTRLALPYQQQIIMTASSWLMGKGLNIVFTSDVDKDIKSYQNWMDNVWNKSNIITLLREVAKITGIETRAAIQFFYDEESQKIKGKVLSIGKGYEIYRHKDENGKMDCIVIRYLRDKIVDGVLYQDVDTTELYLQDKWYRYEGLELVAGYPKESPIKDKLLFAYFEQDYPEYWFVRDLIDKQDYARSQHSDVNVRIGNPALVVHGKLATKPKINDAVKIYEIQSSGSSLEGTTSGTADMKYLEISSAPESVKLEMENNEKDIYRFTYPDLYELLTKAVSGNLSSKSMSLMFTHVFAKMAEKQAVWDDMIRRCISILKSMGAVILEDENILNLDISFTYNSLLPSSIDDLINTLSVAVGAHLTTYERAASQIDFNDPATVKAIKEKFDVTQQEATASTTTKPIDNSLPNPNGVNGG